MKQQAGSISRLDFQAGGQRQFAANDEQDAARTVAVRPFGKLGRQLIEPNLRRRQGHGATKFKFAHQHPKMNFDTTEQWAVNALTCDH